jgi:uncharacterized membrane protein YbhN (UPF0104 family)
LQFRTKIKEVYYFLTQLFQNRTFKFTVQGIILVICIAFLASNFQNSKELLVNIRINYPALASSLFATVLSVYLGALGWGLTLKAVGEKIPRRESTHIHLASNLAKYIPGYAWQLVGKAYLTNQAGASTPGIGFAMVLEIAQLVLIGFGLILIFLPKDLVGMWSNLGFINDQINFIRAIGIFILLIIPGMMILLLKMMRKFRGKLILYPRALFTASSVILAGWLLLGMSFWLLGVAFLPIAVSDIPRFIFTLAASFLIGLAIIIVPGSIGVRESIMVYLLTLFSIASPIAVLIATFSRLILTLSEISLYFLDKLFFHRRNNMAIRENEKE